MTTHELAKLLLKNENEVAVVDVDGILEEITGVIYYDKGNHHYLDKNNKGWNEFDKKCIKFESVTHNNFGFERQSENETK